MKKIILSGAALLAIAAGAVFNVNLNSQSNKLSAVSLANVEALAECENTVNTSGSIITVTVCNRKTNVGGTLLGVSCNADATTSCSFTNVG
ncbi:hypothetical protein AGMMS50239_12500 [Bacteroidia bacterium]|nr:hypothetical protein AGMMS50239_12500 [Bacteroidia bacterium]